MEAKIKGVRHVIAFYVGDTSPIKLYDPFPNENCLHCHREAKGFLEDSNHDPIEDILFLPPAYSAVFARRAFGFDCAASARA